MCRGFHLDCELDYRSGEMHSMQHDVIKFVSDLWQVGGFLRVLRFSPSMKWTILLKVTLSTIIQHNPSYNISGWYYIYVYTIVHILYQHRYNGTNKKKTKLNRSFIWKSDKEDSDIRYISYYYVIEGKCRQCVSLVFLNSVYKI
jgi:hypothetical protein